MNVVLAIRPTRVVVTPGGVASDWLRGLYWVSSTEHCFDLLQNDAVVPNPTAGVMKEEFNKLDELMLKSVRNAMANADVLLTIVDAVRDPMVGRYTLNPS
jgi:hypothetical protein